MNHYYLITVKCGHVGKRRYFKATLPISANNYDEAIDIAINTPRVKHHSTYDVLNVKTATIGEYYNQVKINAKNLYFRCKSSLDIMNYWESFSDSVYIDNDIFEEYERSTRQHKTRGRRTNMAFQAKKYNWDERWY